MLEDIIFMQRNEILHQAILFHAMLRFDFDALFSKQTPLWNKEYFLVNETLRIKMSLENVL